MERDTPMRFPDRRNEKQRVVRVPVQKEHGDKNQKPDERVRIYAAR